MLKGYRTIIFNVVTILATLLAMPEIAQVIPPAYIATLVAVVNIVLRLITTTPVLQAASAAPEPSA